VYEKYTVTAARNKLMIRRQGSKVQLKQTLITIIYFQ